MAINGKGVVLIGGGADDEVSLLEILDHVLNAGVVIHGSIVISLGGVDLVYLGLNVILTSVETALRHLNQAALPPETPFRSRR
ncbi:MAG TPA: gas vesicle protein [Terriglobales bacterium]|nr:gas vesicle protein [Terriglobales bacterium]